MYGKIYLFQQKGGIGMRRDNYKILTTQRWVNKNLLRITRKYMLNGRTIGSETQDVKIR